MRVYYPSGQHFDVTLRSVRPYLQHPHARPPADVHIAIPASDSCPEINVLMNPASCTFCAAALSYTVLQSATCLDWQQLQVIHVDVLQRLVWWTQQHT
jgi:hypothetical protein